MFGRVNGLDRCVFVFRIHDLGDSSKPYLRRAAGDMEVAVLARRIRLLMRLVDSEGCVDSGAVFEFLDKRVFQGDLNLSAAGYREKQQDQRAEPILRELSCYRLGC